MEYRNGMDMNSVTELMCHNGCNSDSPVQQLKRGEAARLKAEEQSVATMKSAYSNILCALGEDTERDGLLKTPLRAAKAMQFLTKGYHQDIYGEDAILFYRDNSIVSNPFGSTMHQKRFTFKTMVYLYSGKTLCCVY